MYNWDETRDDFFLDLKNKYKIKDPFYKMIHNRFYLNSNFWQWTGSSEQRHYHYGYGGLAKHTLEVFELCMNPYYLEKYSIDKNMALCASLYHDIGKLAVYSPYKFSADASDLIEDCEWQKSVFYDTFGYIVISARTWNNDCKDYGIIPEISNSVGHAILAHHGKKEWGSPVVPQSKLAWLLHLADNFSTRMNDGRHEK